MTATKRDFEIPRNLGPGEAPETHAALLAWLGRRAKTARLELSAGDAPAAPLALQLLVAAERSRDHPDIPFGPTASAALAEIDTSRAMETPPR